MLVHCTTHNEQRMISHYS